MKRLTGPALTMTIKTNHIDNKILREIWEQVPPDYYDLGIKNNILQKIWHTSKLKEVLNLLPKDAKSILDVGCSSGILTAAIAKKLPKSSVVGLDSYKEVITFAKKKYPKIKFVCADAHKLPFKNNSFDLVICTETLEHVVNPRKSLLEMKRVLKNDGSAIISMDSGNIFFRTTWFFWTKTTGRVWENAHLHEFNAALLEDLIKKSGFKIKKKENTHLGMGIIFLAVPKNKG